MWMCRYANFAADKTQMQIYLCYGTWLIYIKFYLDLIFKMYFQTNVGYAILAISK